MAERTGYSSQLIPVTSYVTVSAIEAFLRYPEAIKVITASMQPEEIGREARRPGCQANSVFLWGVANFWLIGRNIMSLIPFLSIKKPVPFPFHSFVLLVDGVLV